MKELLFATSNASKVARFSDKLLEKGIILKSLKDIDVDIDVDENGDTAIENAIIKAKASSFPSKESITEEYIII